MDAHGGPLSLQAVYCRLAFSRHDILARTDEGHRQNDNDITGTSGARTERGLLQYTPHSARNRRPDRDRALAPTARRTMSGCEASVADRPA